MCDTEVENEKEAWMCFLSSTNLEEIAKLCKTYPEFIAMYEEVFQFRRDVKELVNMFSEALSVMTKNTERYMVELLQKEVDEKKAEVERANQQIEIERQENAKIQQENAKIQQENKQAQKRIKELEEQLKKKGTNC